MPKPIIRFEIPAAVRNFAKKEKIDISAAKKQIEAGLWEDMIDEKNEPVKEIRNIKIVINGFFKKGKKVYISPGKISKNKPFSITSSGSRDYCTECSSILRPLGRLNIYIRARILRPSGRRYLFDILFNLQRK